MCEQWCMCLCVNVRAYVCMRRELSWGYEWNEKICVCRTMKMNNCSHSRNSRSSIAKSGSKVFERLMHTDRADDVRWNMLALWTCDCEVMWCMRVWCLVRRGGAVLVYVSNASAQAHRCDTYPHGPHSVISLSCKWRLISFMELSVMEASITPQRYAQQVRRLSKNIFV